MYYLNHILCTFFPQLVCVVCMQYIYRRGGLIWLSQAATMGIGAYVYSLGVQNNISFFLLLPVGGILAGFSSMILFPFLGKKNIKFVLGSLIIQLIFTAFCKNSIVLGGETGISGLTTPVLFLNLNSGMSTFFLLFDVILCITLIYSCKHLENSVNDLRLKAIRDNMNFALNMGIDVKLIQTAFLFAASFLTGIAGVLVAINRGGAAPSDFDITKSIMFLSASALAWDDSTNSSLVSGLFLLLTMEILKFLYIRPETELVLYGILIIFVLGRGNHNE